MDRVPVAVLDNEEKATNDHALHSRPRQTEDADGDTPRVLLLRNDPAGSAALVDCLQQFGCECRVATFREGMALLAKQHFDVVLSQFSVADSNAHRLISQLTGSATSLFFCLEVEDGCWWLPAVVAGKDCRGAPAIRAKDFHPILKEFLKQMTSGVHPISTGNSAVLVQPLPSLCAVRRVENETSPTHSRAGEDSAVRRRENSFETSVIGASFVEKAQAR